MKNLKNKFILASAILALASCADNSYLGDQEEKTGTGGPISFGFDVPTPTRAGSAADAGKLGNQFIVYGEKGGTEVATKPSDGNLVFPNYQVNYAENTAGKTTSNTKDWEYVGYKYQGNTSPTLDYPVANITMKDGSSAAINANAGEQTIKYWDYNAQKYVFTAVSAKKEDIANSRVLIQKNLSGTTAYDKGYTITLNKDGSNNYPSLANLYFSDRLVIDKTSTGSSNIYGSNVELTFRNSLSQVRAGIYETIPGYDIVEIKFHTATANEYTTEHAFGAVCKNTSATNFEGTINVVYYGDSDGDLKNKPKVTVTPGTGIQKNYLTLGDNFKSLRKTETPVVLGTTASAPTWDQSEANKYTAVLPQPTNDEDLTLTVDYTLWNSVTKETIEVTGKTAVVPAQYLQWKANYKYTYLFKITDDLLKPITFDAVVVNDGEGNQETITTVSEPSITTFGVIVDNNNAFKNYVTGKNEYQIPTTASTDKLDIYATFMNGNSVGDFTIGTNVNVYKVTSTNETTFPITEASVANSLANPTGNNITCTSKNSDGSTSFGAAPSRVTTVPGEDGSSKTINALKLTGVKESGTYAVEYTPIEQASGTYVLGTTYYSDAAGTTVVDTSTGFTPGTTDVSSYFVKSTTKKAYKVIKVAASN